jgi:hypothetical protein
MRRGRTPPGSGWRSSVSCRTSVIIRAKHVAAAHIQSAPRADAGKPATAPILIFGSMRSVDTMDS